MLADVITEGTNVELQPRDRAILITLIRTCIDQGGYFFGPGGDCSGVATCEVICCFLDASCLDAQSIDSCGAQGGRWFGPGFFECATFDCSMASGACCLPDGTCTAPIFDYDCYDQGGEFLGDGTDCTGQVCTGACCLRDSSCLDDMSQDDCWDQGGWYMGRETTCTTEQCAGGCCLEDGSCTEPLSVDDCEGQNGEWLWPGGTCAEVDCSRGCCLPDGSCADVVFVQACWELGGNDLGWGSDCSGADCTGACCLLDNSCVEGQSLDECRGQDGRWFWPGSTCGEFDCPAESRGACCLIDGSCIAPVFEVNCLDQDGEYQGNGTDCTTSCNGACCAGDHSCGNTTRAVCVGAGETYLGEGSDCTGSPCAGIGCDVGVIGQVPDPENAPTDEYLDILSAQIAQTGTSVTFSIQTRGNIPTTPPGLVDEIVYLWLIDADIDPSTGQWHGGVGSEFNVRVAIAAGSIWGGVDVTGVLPGGGEGTVVLQDNQVSITVELLQIGWPTQFTWRSDAFAAVDGGCCTGDGETVIVSSVVCGPAPVGACCLPTISCDDNLTLSECDIQAGIWAGPDSTCDGSFCVPVEWPTAGGGNGHVYMRVLQYAGTTWSESRTAATSWSYAGAPGHLATSTSQEENDFLSTTFPGVETWLGGYQPDPGQPADQGWVWATGEAWSYTNWAPGEPNDFGGDEAYLILWSDATWNDGADWYLGNYIVEFSGCTQDCNANGTADIVDIGFAQTSVDCNGNTIPDECEIGTFPVSDLPAAFCEIQYANNLIYEAYADNRTGGNPGPGAENSWALTYSGVKTLGAGSAEFIGPVYTDPDAFFPTVQRETARGFLVLHPGEQLLGGPASMAAVVIYVAPAAGTYRFVGDFARANDFQLAGDGVDVLAFSSYSPDTPLFAANISSDHVVDPDDPFSGTGVEHFDFTVTLDASEELRFAVLPGAPGDLDIGFDATAFRMTATRSDCNANGSPDDCDVDGGGSPDDNGDGIPDECETAIPTVSEWGLVTMTLFMLTAGTLVLGRRRLGRTTIE